MIYLENFTLRSELEENMELALEKRHYISNNYPYHLFSSKGLKKVDFEPVTIFYGGNGSGKSTLLNIIACFLHASGSSSSGEMFTKYLSGCKCQFGTDKPFEIKIIKSDDIFDFLLTRKKINNYGAYERESLVREYLSNSQSNVNSISDYEALKRSVDAKKKNNVFICSRKNE